MKYFNFVQVKFKEFQITPKSWEFKIFPPICFKIYLNKVFKNYKLTPNFFKYWKLASKFSKLVL
jgi:hypothetical protein